MREAALSPTCTGFVFNPRSSQSTPKPIHNNCRSAFHPSLSLPIAIPYGGSEDSCKAELRQTSLVTKPCARRRPYSRISQNFLLKSPRGAVRLPHRCHGHVQHSEEDIYGSHGRPVHSFGGEPSRTCY